MSIHVLRSRWHLDAAVIRLVIKNGEKITYYGGKAQQMEKTTRVKARVKAQALQRIYRVPKSVLWSWDTRLRMLMRSELPLVFTVQARTLGKKAHIVVNDPSTSIRPLMAGLL